MKQLIVIPAFNEAQTIQNVIMTLRAHGYTDVLVVDDASQDETATIARQAGAAVVSLAYQLGAWRAAQTGFRFALENGYNEVVTFDADGQHLPSSVHSLVQHRDSADVVIGSCLTRGTRLRRLAWAFFRCISRVPVMDFTSGLRFYNARAIELLASEAASSLEYQDMGVLMLLSNTKLSITEVSVEMAPRQAGISRIFSSWWAVAYYMSYTTSLCLAKLGHNPFHSDRLRPEV